MSGDDIRKLIATKLAASIQGAILEVFGSIKTKMIELFDERYVAVSEVVAAATTAVVAVVGV